MANYNRVILVGNLTRNPELSYTPTNTAVCSFGMAINRKWRDRDGNSQDEVCFVELTAFSRQAETINQYMTKGRSILVEGRLRYRQWTDKEGQKRNRLDVVVDNFTFLGGGGGGPGGGRAQGGGRTADEPAEEPPPYDEAPPPQGGGGESEIPF